jgi:hypothetical protein
MEVTLGLNSPDALPIGKDMNSIVCPSTADCEAVGNGQMRVTTNVTAVATARTSYGQWAHQNLPAQASDVDAYSVSCPSMTICYAVAETSANDGDDDLCRRDLRR